MNNRIKKLLYFYDTMLLIRRFEEQVAKAYANQKIKGFCHLYIGEEAVAVGAIGSIEKTDYVITTYRDHGHAIAKGVDPKAIMAELFGKERGVSHGLGGSMHLFDVNQGFMGGHGIVGGHISLATGLGFGCDYKNEKNVVLCFMGEGAVSIGSFHEGISLAALWRLPVIFIIENNFYSMGTPLHKHLHERDISIKANAYGLPSAQVDGSQVMNVFHSVKEAVIRARSGRGPTILEIITYRYKGHSMSDPAQYRTIDEVKHAKEKDPIQMAYAELIEAGIKEKVLKDIDNQNKEDAKEAIVYADESAYTSSSDIDRFIFTS